MSRWFRFYEGVVDDPKVQRLPAPLFKFWVNTLCLASANGGEMPSLADMSFKLRMSEKQVVDSLQKLVDAGLVDELDGVSTPHNWSGRQYESDSAAERMRRHRAKKKENALRDALRNSDVPDTEQIQSRTETETESVEVAQALPPTGELDLGQADVPKKSEKPPKHELPDIPETLSRATRWDAGRAVPVDWIADGQATRREHGLPEINLDLEAAKFAAHWASKPGKDGRKLDWRLTWLNWARSARGVPIANAPQAGGKSYFQSGEIISLSKGAA